MESRVGEQNLGEFARWQFEVARRDPRLDRRGRKAMVADFWLALEEAERARFLSILGLDELQHALEREEARLGVPRDDERDHESLSDEELRSLQAAWERSESARVEIDNDYPHLNAQALLSMNSALDALVEDFPPAMRKIHVSGLVDQVVRRVLAQAPEEVRSPTPEEREQLQQELLARLEEKFPMKKLAGSGAKRYEKRLAQVGLGAPPDRLIPMDMDEALRELGELRDALVHRAGRGDERALRRAPSLRKRYADGELIRISRDDYRRYSAAIRCYAQEIGFRSVRHWPEASDEDGPDLAHWNEYYRLGA